MKFGMQAARHLAAASCMAFTTHQLTAQEVDVTFFVVGKHASYTQSESGTPQLGDHSFFSEIFLTENGDIVDAFLSLPGGERLRFNDHRFLPGPDRDNLLGISGKTRYQAESELEEAYPDGDYRLDFTTPSGRVENAVVNFTGPAWPTAPVTRLAQNGAPVSWLAVDPEKDLQVAWSAFASGRADPNGVLDDLIFVIAKNCRGEKVAHSGRPFEGKSFLVYSDTGYAINADSLEPGQRYSLQLEHADLVDTRTYNGIPALATYAVTTSVAFQTTGENIGSDDCPESAPGDLQTAAQENSMPSIDSQTVMFYYDDLQQASEFYEQILGLEKTLDFEWVKFYRISDSSHVGIVRAGDGAYHSPQSNNAVMLSIVTSEVDAWYERLKAMDKVPFLQDIHSGDAPVRSFLVQDPGGYTVEFFQWLEQP